MVGTSELGRMFKRGDTKGIASRTQIIEDKNFTYLLEYGHAILAKRSKRTGEVLYYSGWDRYSPSTSKHITQLGLRGADFVSKKAKKLGDLM